MSKTSKKWRLERFYWRGLAPVLIVLFLVLVAVVLWWNARESQRDFQSYQSEIMERAVDGVSNQIVLLLEGLLTSLSLVVEENEHLLWDLAEIPNNTKSHADISQRLKRYFPEYFAFTLAGKDGRVYYDDLGERVGDLCREDIGKFLQANYKLDIVIHPGPGKYHFDMMLPWRNRNGDTGVFFASFEPTMISRLLRDSQVPGHQLILLRNDADGLIEVMAAGARPEVKKTRPIRLGPDELKRIIHSKHITHTRWTLVDLPSETLFSRYNRNTRNQALTVFGGFVLVSILMLIFIRHADNRRTAAETALRESHDQLELANQSKSRFLAVASHDLRQPMHALGLFIDQLAIKLQSHESLKIVKHAHASLKALEELFDALLDISKLDAGALKPDVKNFRIDALLEIIGTDFGPVAREKGLRFRVVSSKLVVRSDPVMLERILINLVSNAVRYTAEGSVLIGCRRHGENVRIQVWDTGYGIPEEEKQNVFREFYQYKGVTQGSGKSLGVGLTIVKRLADLLGHDIQLVSALGKGSMFAVEVPIVSVQPHRQTAHATQPSQDRLADAYVILVDNDKADVERVREFMTSSGCHLAIAESYSELLGMLHEVERLPDVLICNCWLPQKAPGKAVVEHVRVDLLDQIPVILISEDTSPERLSEARELGYHLLPKPVQPAKLRALVNQILGNRQPTKATA